MPSSAEPQGKETLYIMNDQNITQAFEKITAQADACRVERNVREHQMKKNQDFVKRPIRGIAVLAAVLILIMVPISAFGIVYGYRAWMTDNGYAITIEGSTAPIKLEEQKLSELGQYAMRFDNGADANIHDFGKSFDSYDALDAWLDGIMLTSPMLDGECVLYCTDDNAGTPIAAHITGANSIIDRDLTCAVSITVPLFDIGEAIGWETRYADMISTETIRAENGIEAEFVTTETSVTAYFAHSGILYRLNIAGNHEEAAAVLTEMISTMK